MCISQEPFDIASNPGCGKIRILKLVHSNLHITGYFIPYIPQNNQDFSHVYLTNCQSLELVAFLRQHHSLRDLTGDDHDDEHDDEHEHEN